MPNPITLTPIDSRETGSFEVSGNLVITSRGSVAVTNAYYAVKILTGASQLAATVNGGVSLTTNLNTVFGMQILAAEYTIKVGSYRPTFQLALNGKTTDASALGELISGTALTLGNAADPAVFGANFNVNVVANGSMATASSYAFLADSLTVASQQFAGTVASSARSAAGDAQASGIQADQVSFNRVTSAARLTVTATAGNMRDTRSASASGISAGGGISAGDFAAAVNVSANAGAGVANVTDASAYAYGMRSLKSVNLGLIGNSFTVNAKAGNAVGSDAEAFGLSATEGSTIGGVAAGVAMNISANSFYDATACGIQGGTGLTVSGDCNGTWNISATGGDGVAATSTPGVTQARMLYSGNNLLLTQDFNAAVTVRATNAKGQNSSAIALESAGRFDSYGRIGGSITSEAKVSGKSSLRRQGGVPQSEAYGFYVAGNSSIDDGFAANFRLNVTASGIDSAMACGLRVNELISSGALAGNWTVSATSTGGETSGGYAGDARAYGINVDGSYLSAATVAGSKLTLNVSASGNTANQSSITDAYAGATGIYTYATLALGDLGMLTVSARSGKSGGSSESSAYGIIANFAWLESTSGMNITANAATAAKAIGLLAHWTGYGNGVAGMLGNGISHDLSIGTLAGSNNVSATASEGAADAVGLSADQISLNSIQTGASLTVRANGGASSSNNTSAFATGISGGLVASGMFSALTVAAVSGRNSLANNATAFGVESGVSSLICSFKAINVSANAVNRAEATGLSALQSTVLETGVWTVGATSSAGSAKAVGVAGDLFSQSSSSKLTVRAAGGTFALVNNAPAPGTDSSADAIGIDGNVLNFIPNLTVSAIAGRNAEYNNATAYGVKGTSGGISFLRRINVSATATDAAAAIGYAEQSLLDCADHVETISATSDRSTAASYGCRVENTASVNFGLGGILTVSARGAENATASGMSSTQTVQAYASSSILSRLAVTANSVNRDANATGLTAGQINFVTGLWGSWTVTATANNGSAAADLFNSQNSGMTVGINGSYTATATAKNAATASGFSADGASFSSGLHDSNFTLTVNAKSSADTATTSGFRFASFNYYAGSNRDSISVIADGVKRAKAFGVEVVSSDYLVMNTNSSFAFTVTARSSKSEAVAYAICNTTGSLLLLLDGTINVSATGGVNNQDSTAAIACGVYGGETGTRSASIFRTLNVSAKSGSGSSFYEDTAATATGVDFTGIAANDDSSYFDAAAQTRMTVKADGGGIATADGVKSRNLCYSGNGGSLTVSAAATAGRATATGFSSENLISVGQGAMTMNIAATAGKAADPLDTNNNAVAFGLVAGNWDTAGNLINASDSVIMFNSSGVYFDGVLNVNAKAVAGATAATREAHAAAFAADVVGGNALDSFKVAVAAAADRRARAFGMQGSDKAGSQINFGFAGNWKITASTTANLAEADAWGGAATAITINSASSQSQLLVSAEADGTAWAYGFDAADSFTAPAFAMTLTVNATSRKNAGANAIGIETRQINLDLDGAIAATASGGDNPVAVGIAAATGTIKVDGVIAAATVKTGNAYALRGESGGTGLVINVTGALFGGKNGNAAGVATQLGNLVKSGGSAASWLSSITPAPTSSDRYYAVSGTINADTLTLSNNAISVGDIDLGAGDDTLTVGATSQVVGNVNGVERINILINSDPGKNPIFTVRDSAGSLDAQLFATLDNAQLGTYVLAQGAKNAIGAMTRVSLVINNNTELFLGEISQKLDTGAFGRLSLVTTGTVSKLVLEITYAQLGTPPAGGNYLPPSDSSSLSLPNVDAPPAAGSSGLSFEEDFRLYGVGAADLQLGASDALFAGEQNADPFKKGLLAG